MSTASARSHFFTSVIGRKILVALTGLFFVSFLIVHLTGNLLLFRPDEGAAFNAYALFMGTNGIIAVLEWGLFIGILSHIVLALYVNSKSGAARKTRYAVNRPSKKVPFASRFMVHTSIVILLWLMLHMYDFFMQHRIFPHPADQSMYHLVEARFSNPFAVGIYLVAMIMMCFHVSHGLYSAIQTLGAVINKKIERVVRFISWSFAIIISAGFAAIPVYFFFFN